MFWLRVFEARNRVKRLGFLTAAVAALACAGESSARPVLNQNVPGIEAEAATQENAVAALAHNELAKASNLFQTLINRDPHSYQPYIGLSDVEIRRGNYDAADACLLKGIAANPDDTHLPRARAHLADIQKHYRREERLLTDAATAHPGDAGILLDLARLYGGPLDDPQRALDFYEAAAKAAPMNADVQYIYARALAAQKRIAEALSVLDAAQKAAPDSPIPLLTAAQIYLRDKRLADALDKVDAVLRITPGLEAANLLRGAILQSYGRYREALDIYEAILKTDAKSVPAHLGAGLVKQAMDRKDEAAQEFEIVLDADRDNVVALNNLAWRATETKDGLALARQRIARAIGLEPDDAALRDTSGWLYYTSGNLDAAWKELNRGLTFAPSASLFYHMGVVEAELGHKQAAIKLLQTALQLQPWMEPAMTALWDLDKRPS
jgi:tetratricopeptide (TPR) repeat protein